MVFLFIFLYKFITGSLFPSSSSFIDVHLNNCFLFKLLIILIISLQSLLTLHLEEFSCFMKSKYESINLLFCVIQIKTRTCRGAGTQMFHEWLTTMLSSTYGYSICIQNSSNIMRVNILHLKRHQSQALFFWTNYR